MVKDDILKKVAERAGIKPEDFITAVKAENETDFNLEETQGSFYNDADLEALKERIGKEKYNEGKQAGSEMTIKEAREKYKLDFEGKSIDNLVDAVKKSVSKDASVREKELQTSLESLQSKYEKDITEKDTAINQMNSQFKQMTIRNEIISQVPKLDVLKPDQFVMLAESNFTFDKSEEGSILVKDKSGNVLKDKLERPIKPADILEDFAVKNGWVKKDGRGDGNYGGGAGQKFKTKNEAFAYMEKNGIMPDSNEAKTLLEAVGE